MKARGDLSGKTVFVVGGSAGLGKEMSKVMAAQGAHITIFARKRKLLDEARREILAARRDESQTVHAVSADMSVSSNVHSIFSSQPQLADVVYCVAGGTSTECGFLLDLDADVFERCMNNNYFSSLYPAQAALKLWTEDDKKVAMEEPQRPTSPRERKIIFVNSSASLVAAPGYLAYSAAKSAQRSLADTLRLEVMRYSGPISTYKVQCVFAHNYITPTFLEENKNKPALTKRIEGTTDNLADLEKRFPYANQIAPEIVAAAATGDFAVLDKRLEPQIWWANMVGSSPKRGLGIVDWLLGFLMSLLFPFVRWEIEKHCKADAKRKY